MARSIPDRLKRIPANPVGFLAVESAIVALSAALFSLLNALTRWAGGRDYGWPFLFGILISLGLLAAAALLVLLDLWVFFSLLTELKPGSGPRQRLRARLPSLACLGLATCGALYALLTFTTLIVPGVAFIGSTVLASAYLLITAPRLTPGILLRGLCLVILMILMLWLPFRAAFGEEGSRRPSPPFGSKPQAGQNANRTGANLNGASLTRADLEDADLSGVDLTRANLSNADLTGANLRRADLRYANLQNSRVTAGQLVEAKSLKGAILPDGSVHE